MNTFFVRIYRKWNINRYKGKNDNDEKRRGVLQWLIENYRKIQWQRSITACRRCKNFYI